jgi:hypothetical protein
VVVVDQAPLRTTPAVVLVEAGSRSRRPHRTPTARKGMNAKAGSIQGVIGDHIPPVIGRDKRDLKTLAATRKVATQTGAAGATIRDRFDLGKKTQPSTTSPARWEPTFRARTPVLSSTSYSPAQLGGDADATKKEMFDLGKPTKRLPTFPPGCNPGVPVLSSSDTSVRLVDSTKSSSASAHAERQKAQTAAAAEARDRTIAEAENIGEGGPDDTVPPGVVRLEDQNPIAPPRRLPGPPNSRSNTQNSLPPAEGVESQEQDLADPGNVDYSDGDSIDEYGEDDDIYEDARAIGEKVPIPGIREALTEEEYEAFCRQQFQKQHERHRQMYLQQQQLLEVAQAVALKPPGSRSTTTVLGIGVGGSSDKPQSSKEKSLRRKIVELEYALQQANSSAMNLDHHYRKLWSRANAQSEELQRSQRQVCSLLDDNRSLTPEIEAVKAQLVDAKSLLEAKCKELKDAQVFLATRADTLSTTDVVQKVNALNEEIFQAAALLGEMLQNSERKDRTQEQITEAFEKARWMLGEQMASILAVESSNIRTDLNPLLVQVVLQIAITTWCRFVVSSWKPSDSTVADFLAAIYSEIRQLGE